MMTRTVRSFCLLLVFSAFTVLPAARSAPSAPRGLTCELLRRPARAVITDRRPEFGWIVNDPARGAEQSAYRLIVATTKEKARPGRADVWDTGRVESGRSLNVEYAGPPLQPDTGYWWTVKTWDGSGDSGPFARPRMFRTGEFDRRRPWPAASRWRQVPADDGQRWVLEDRQAMRFHEVRPEEFVRTDDGRCFVDFGRDAYATLQITLEADEEPEGDTVEIHLGERRSGPHTVDRDPGGTVRYRKVSLELKPGTRTYTLDFPDHGVIKLHDHLNGVMPFRYCEIVGAPGEVTKGDVRQLALFYPFDDDDAGFHSSDRTLNEVWELCKYSMKATNAFGIFIDGDRERKPYEADAYINQLGYYCCDREYAISRYSHEYLLFHPTWPTEWILHSVLMARADWMWTGNKESMERYYEDLKAKTLSALAREDGLLETGRVEDEAVLQSIHRGGALRDIVDWPAGERDGYVFRPVNTVVNALYYRALRDMAEMAEALGKLDDARGYRQRARKVYRSFNRTLFDTERGIYVDGEGTDHASLHANMFPLAFGLVPQDRLESVTRFVKSKGMACSVYGAQYLLESLYRAGEDEYARRLMTDTSTDRSWPHMIHDLGTTITAEAWDRKYKPNMDWNHAWGAAPANVIPRMLVGVRPLEPGFRRVLVRPRPGGLETVRATVPTPRGPIKVSYRKHRDNGCRLAVTVPANTRALVHVPAPPGAEITEGGKPAGRADHVRPEGRTEQARVFAIDAGEYVFHVR